MDFTLGCHQPRNYATVCVTGRSLTRRELLCVPTWTHKAWLSGNYRLSWCRPAYERHPLWFSELPWVLRNVPYHFPGWVVCAFSSLENRTFVLMKIVFFIYREGRTNSTFENHCYKDIGLSQMTKMGIGCLEEDYWVLCLLGLEYGFVNISQVPYLPTSASPIVSIATTWNTARNLLLPWMVLR